MSIEARQRKEKVHEAISAFIGTFPHTEFVAATSKDLAAVESRILEDDVTKIEDLFELLDLRGQRRVLKANLSLFEDTVATLEAQIKQMKLEEQQPNATQQEEQNEEQE